MKVVVAAFVVGAVFIVVLDNNPRSQTGKKSEVTATKERDCSIGELSAAEQGNNIFFVETDDALTSFHPRHLCAFEAAAAHNPDSVVHVVVSLHSNISNYPGYLQKSHPNLRFARADFDLLVEDTPVRDVWKSQVLRQSWCFLRHASDVIRLVLLYKFGGAYLDTDVILLDQLPALDNFVVPYEKNHINGAVIKFQKGNKFVLDSLLYMPHDYKHDKYFNPGQELLTKVARNICGRENVSMDREEVMDCKDFAILLPNSSYAVPFMFWTDFLDASKVGEVRAKLRDSFAAHYWFYMTQVGGAILTAVDRGTPLYKLFEENCPATEELLLRSTVWVASEEVLGLVGFYLFLLLVLFLAAVPVLYWCWGIRMRFRLNSELTDDLALAASKRWR